MLKFKDSVKCPKSVIIVAAVHNAREILGYAGDTLVTSMNDSQHMIGSRHYTDEAADFRTHDLFRVEQETWASAVRKRLGPDYDVVLEPDHLHVEYDPKRSSDGQGVPLPISEPSPLRSTSVSMST